MCDYRRWTPSPGKKTICRKKKRQSRGSDARREAAGRQPLVRRSSDEAREGADCSGFQQPAGISSGQQGCPGAGRSSGGRRRHRGRGRNPSVAGGRLLQASSRGGRAGGEEFCSAEFWTCRILVAWNGGLRRRLRCRGFSEGVAARGGEETVVRQWREARGTAASVKEDSGLAKRWSCDEEGWRRFQVSGDLSQGGGRRGVWLMATVLRQRGGELFREEEGWFGGGREEEKRRKKKTEDYGTSTQKVT